ncbi:Ger(x)C family spore germination C-terminal domain-containing protein [Paenibacillus sp. GCM10027628]
MSEQVRIHYPKVWEQIKEDWDQTFSTVPIKYTVKLPAVRSPHTMR